MRYMGESWGVKWGAELFPATLPPWASAPVSVVSLEPTRKNDAACWNWRIIKTWKDATLTHFSSHTESLFLALYTLHIYQIFVGLAISLLHLPLLHMPLPLLGTRNTHSFHWTLFSWQIPLVRWQFTSFERDCLSREVPLDEVSLLMATRAHSLMTYIFCFLHILCSLTRLKVLGKQGSCLSYS